ncbi:glutamate ABC transporter substrate-binding protein [Phytomonospora sp. NPDC050363]|uniref:glutamate ABC transporter substrate-binding protein n=1 Tax=Phytomonospora sp. NPDC050363 TaxID=3155642 RepID=UPI0033E35927
MAIILTVLGLLPLAACGEDEIPSAPTGSRYVMTQAPEDSLPAEIQAIKESGRLLVGTRFDQPLTGLRNEATGRIDGFDAEVGRIIAQRIFGTVEEGVNIEFIETLAKSRTTYLSSEQVDMVIATFTINDERKAEVDFAGPYYVAGQDILVKADNKDINSVEDLVGKSVCAAKGSTSAKELKKQAGVEVVELKDYSSCVTALDGAEPVDAVSTDNVILQGFTQSDPDAYRVLNKTFTTERYGIGLKHGSPELRKFINETLEESFRNGDWDRAFDMTFGHTNMKRPDDYPKIENY